MDKALLIFSMLLLAVGYVNAEPSISDPTKPITYTSSNTTKQKAINEYQLTGIFYKQGKYEAVINNHLYKRGDYLGNNKIISIDMNNVVIEGEAGKTKLSLLTPFKKLKKK